MKREAVLSLSIAALSFAFFLPNGAQAQQKYDSTGASGVAQNASSTMGQTEAARMVPAEAILAKTIDSKTAKPGEQFEAKLSDTVHLKNGTELPRGTELIGKVVADDMHTNGTSRLALRFTQAQLKDGKTIPIKATIVSLYNADGAQGDGANFWNASTLQIDQERALSGVELHSRIADKNSGVLVSTKKDDVKVPHGYGIALAIAASTSGQQNGNS